MKKTFCSLLVAIGLIGLPAISKADVSYDNVNGTINWSIGNEESPIVSDAISGALAYSTYSVGNDLTFEQTEYTINSETQEKQTFVKYTPGTSNAGNVEGVMIEYLIKTESGITITPNAFYYDVIKVGTDGATFSYSYVIDGTESEIITVDASTVRRNNNSNESTTDITHEITVDTQNEYNAESIALRFYISSTANNKSIAIGNVKIDGTYNGSIKGTSYENAEASVVWNFNSDTDYATVSFVSPEGTFSTTSFDLGSASVTGTGTRSSEPLLDNITFVKIRPLTDGNDLIEWYVKPASGLTFTPTQVSMYIQRFGTDAQNGVTITAKLDDGTSETLGNYTAPRANNTQDADKYGANENYTSYVVIDLNEEQQTKLSSSEGLHLYSTIGVGNAKDAGFSDIHINGLLNGMKSDVNKYTLSMVASPKEGGEVTVYPNASEYEEGAEVTITATQNFGYHFINWTDQEGKEVSNEASFKYTINADATLTANFSEVNTYELNYSVEGGANLYMVQPSPEPTVVDGKNMYEEGTHVILTASNNAILTFTNWTNGETSATISLDMTKDITITANYDAIDFVAGWDFYLSGSNGRKADFYSADNDVAQLILRNAAGEIQGWLDKSEEAAGGYEGRPGAVNWRDTGLGDYYWQTELNCSNFTSLSIQTSMVYNYNAYQIYNVQYSFDNENWETAGSINMPGAKTWTDVTINLPETCNNKDKVYLRWIADTSSNIDGTETEKDGACLGATWILGTEAYVNDGIAPVLLSTVPEQGSTSASANGRIVLSFDEKVKVSNEEAQATLGEITLSPTVSGKTVIFEYKGLEYSTEYEFVLPANTIADLGDNYYSEEIKINFQTKTKPEVTKGLYDFVVPDNGTFNDAITAANSRTSTDTRFRIFVKDGSYQITNTEGKTVTGSDEIEYPSVTTYLNVSNVSIIGESMDSTVVYNSPTSVIEGLGKATNIYINSGVTNTYFQDIKITHDMGDNGRVAVLQDRGNKTICKNVWLDGYQDTYYSNQNNSRFYFETSRLGGRVDYLCGGGDVVYNQCELVVKASGCKITAASTPLKNGYVFLDCTITGESSLDGQFTLGRPWSSGACKVQYINTTMEIQPTAAGWEEMGDGWPAVFKEYNSHTANGTAVSLENRKTVFGDNHEVDTQTPLTADEVAELTVDKVMGGDDDWDPTESTEQASAPTNVVLNSDNSTLTWDDSNYILLWAICKDGKVVDFTTTNTYTVSDVASTWSVRAANEMGGLGEATLANIATGIDTTKEKNVNVVKTETYSLQGVRIPSTYKGVVIKVNTNSNGEKNIVKVLNN